MNITNTKTLAESIKDRLLRFKAIADRQLIDFSVESSLESVTNFNKGAIAVAECHKSLLELLIEDLDLALGAIEMQGDVGKVGRREEYKSDITFSKPDYNPLEHPRRLFGYHERYERYYRQEKRKIDIDRLPVWQREELNMMARQAAKLNLDYLYGREEQSLFVFDLHSNDLTIQQGFIMEIQ